MRFAISLGWFGYLLDFSFGPTEYEDEPAIKDLGSCTSYPVGFAPSVAADWEKPINGYDEPGEGHEDT